VTGSRQLLITGLDREIGRSRGLVPGWQDVYLVCQN
jgi:hypothetical protein